jgi:hypothetical protein
MPDTLESLETELAAYWDKRGDTVLTYAVEASKDGHTAVYGFHSIGEAEKWIRRAKRENYQTRLISRPLMEVLTELAFMKA